MACRGARSAAATANAAPVAVLHLPAALSRPRTFDVDVTLLVLVPEGGVAWRQLSLELDGQQQWQRRFPSHVPSDGLDYYCRIRLEPGRALRIRGGGGECLQRAAAVRRSALKICSRSRQIRYPVMMGRKASTSSTR